LFDTGPDGGFMHNAAQMGVDLTHLTAVVLSHGHYDHCGGVPWLADNSRIICHPQIACDTLSYGCRNTQNQKTRMITTTLDSSWNTPASRWLSAIAFCGPGNQRPHATVLWCD
jgi:metal-dependent hydrolase (beta-lactamase superfamily II)